jgi:hypothetical protein
MIAGYEVEIDLQEDSVNYYISAMKFRREVMSSQMSLLRVTLKYPTTYSCVKGTLCVLGLVGQREAGKYMGLLGTLRPSTIKCFVGTLFLHLPGGS